MLTDALKLKRLSVKEESLACLHLYLTNTKGGGVGILERRAFIDTRL